MKTILDDILIRQKEMILQKINNGEFSSARAMLDVVKEFWCASDYEYKWKELKVRLKLG